MELVLLELVSSKRKEKVVWNSMDLPSVWLMALPFVVRWVDLWMRGRHRRSPCLQTRVLSSSVTPSLCHRLDCSTAGYIEKLDYQVEKVLINAYILPEGWSQVVFFRAILSLITLRGDTILTLSWFVSMRKNTAMILRKIFPAIWHLLGKSPHQHGLNSALTLPCGECEPKRPSEVCFHLNDSVIDLNYIWGAQNMPPFVFRLLLSNLNV